MTRLLAGIAFAVFLFFSLLSFYFLIPNIELHGALKSLSAQPWLQTEARFDTDFTLGDLGAKASEIGYATSRVIYPNPYRYKANGKECRGVEFELGQGNDLLPAPTEDKRVDNFTARHCASPPREQKHGEVTLYNYSCKPFPIFYNPKNACISYIEKPMDPAGLQQRIFQSILRSACTAFALLALALFCLVKLRRPRFTID